MTTLLKGQSPGGYPGDQAQTRTKQTNKRSTTHHTPPSEPCQETPKTRRFVVNTRIAPPIPPNATPPADETEAIVREYATTVHRLIALATMGLERARTDAEWTIFFKLRYALYKLLFGGD